MNNGSIWGGARRIEGTEEMSNRIDYLGVYGLPEEKNNMGACNGKGLGLSHSCDRIENALSFISIP